MLLIHGARSAVRKPICTPRSLRTAIAFGSARFFRIRYEFDWLTGRTEKDFEAPIATVRIGEGGANNM